MREPKREFSPLVRDHVREPFVNLGRDAVCEEFTRRPPVVFVDHPGDDLREGTCRRAVLRTVLERLLENVCISEYRVTLSSACHLVFEE